MSTWRRTALELFPELERDLRSSRVGYTVYSLLRDLHVSAQKAHARGDTQELEKIYGYAEWCSRQQAEDLWNAAGVAFYEHLFESERDVDRVLPFLSAYAIRKHWDLWAVWYEDRWPAIRGKLEQRLEELSDDPGTAITRNWG